MLIIYCADPLNARQPDEMYRAEVEAAQQVGLPYALINFENVLAGDAERAVSRVPPQAAPNVGIFRGWMLTPNHYTALYDALLTRGVRLINSPAQYKHTHYLPESYGVIMGLTPRSVWLPITDGAVNFDQIMRLLEQFGTQPLVLKDYVKSQKYYWNEAVYIQSAAERSAVERVVGRFLELQGETLNEGLVFREYIPYVQLDTPDDNGMPVIREYRTFWLDHAPLLTMPHWDGIADTGIPPDTQPYIALTHIIDSRFFTMDIAESPTGWQIVELGDGQVAGLPDSANPLTFYRALSSSKL